MTGLPAAPLVAAGGSVALFTFLRKLTLSGVVFAPVICVSWRAGTLWGRESQVPPGLAAERSRHLITSLSLVWAKSP